jgi:hypothetical protein
LLASSYCLAAFFDIIRPTRCHTLSLLFSNGLAEPYGFQQLKSFYPRFKKIVRIMPFKTKLNLILSHSIGQNQVQVRTVSCRTNLEPNHHQFRTNSGPIQDQRESVQDQIWTNLGMNQDVVRGPKTDRTKRLPGQKTYRTTATFIWYFIFYKLISSKTIRLTKFIKYQFQERKLSVPI